MNLKDEKQENKQDEMQDEIKNENEIEIENEVEDEIKDKPNDESKDKTEYKAAKLWHPVSFLLIGALFSFLPAAILYALNWGRLGHKKKRNLSLLVSLVLFAAIIILVLFSKDAVMRYLSYGLNIALGFLMYKDQIDAYKDHLENGGRKASIWLPALACLAVAAAITWVSYVGSITPDGVVQIEGDELYYTDEVQLADVEKLANYLVQKKLLLVKDDHAVSVKLDKDGATYVFSVVILAEYADNEKMTADFKALAKGLSQDVFKSKVEVELCDDKFNPIKIIEN